MIERRKPGWLSLLVLALILAIAAGCASGQNESASQNNGGSPSPSDRTDSQKKTGEKIVFWHYLNDRHDLLVGMANDFKSQTGIEVDVQLFGGDGFKQKIIASAQTNSLPDLMTYFGGAGDLAKLIETKSVMELGGKMGDTFKKFPESVVKAYSYREGNPFNVKDYGTYAVPMDTNNMQFIYNKDLFAQAGITEPPQTWEQLLQAVDKLNAAGITPFATGIGSWVIGPMAAPYEFAYLGEEKLIRVKEGKEPLIGSGYENVLKIFEDLYKHKAFAEGIATMDLPKAEQMFVNGEVAMIFDGSWAIGVFNQMDPNFQHYDVFMPPKPADAAHEVKITGGIGVPLVVSQKTKHQDAVLKFVDYLVAKEQQQKYAEKSFNLPANMEAAKSEGEMSSALRNFSLGMQHVYESAGIYPSPNVDTAMQKGVQLIVIGQSTPDKVLKQMDEALQKALKEKK
ncbi:ABC transporter substrate-binding protein [Cohnella laeviribosi]|uniref:ABC transporter substrate-binding protein n=1 Tax=Cohnella laeviribosi TaxID=380174 RepID=UPI00038299DC|nr:ABC transporter substrate-binding protein [Cohnella laeviribosi]